MFNEVLERLPSNIASGFGNRYQPPTEDQLAQCSKLLEEEKAIFVANLRKETTGPTGHKGKGTPSGSEFKKAGKKSRKITERSPREILLGALREWHKFETSNFNYEPISMKALVSYIKTFAPEAKACSRTNLYRMFDEVFKGRERYKVFCHNKTILEELKSLSGEYSPHQLRLKLEEAAQEAATMYRLTEED